MDRITPTGWARSGGRAVEQLGSTRAVVAALPDGATIIAADRREIASILTELGRNPAALRVMSASGAASAEDLGALPRTTRVGVAVGVFERFSAAEYEAAYRHLARFTGVIWG